MFDLHMHTTRSDGLSSPAELVEQVRAAGLAGFHVTDHDTMAAVAEAGDLAARAGLTFVPGVELTTVGRGRDVHLLAYWVEPEAAFVGQLLARQRELRAARARGMAAKLAAAGRPIDIDGLLSEADPASHRSVGRPLIARALVEAGHVSSIAEAFSHWLGKDGPAYLPHQGPSPEEAVRLVRDAGGVTSHAHPGVLKMDHLIPDLVEAGLAAIEACHSEHTAAIEAHYRGLARELGLAVSGGSDYHGAGTWRAPFLGKVGITREELDELWSRACPPR